MNPTEILQAFQAEDITALQAYVRLKKLEDATKATMETVKRSAREEFVRQYGEKEGGNIEGCRVTFMNGRRMYNYDHISEYQVHKKAIKAIEDNAKWAAEFAQKHPGKPAVDATTGEVLVPAKVTYAEDGLQVKIGL